MSINLLDLLKSEVGSQLLGPASQFLGESELSTNKALSGILPSILGALVDKGTTAKGGGNLMDLLGKADISLLDNIGSVFGGGSSGGGLSNLLSGGSGILSMLLGDHKIGALVNVLSSFSGMKNSSASTLLKLAAPFIMGALSKKVKSMGLDGLGLSKLLGEQKDVVKAALPEGFSGALGLASLEDSFMDKAGDAAESAIDKLEDLAEDVMEKAEDVAEDVMDTVKSVGQKVGKTASETGQAAIDAGKKGSSTLIKWLLPALLALLVLGWLGRKGCNTGVDALDDAAESVVNTTENMAGSSADAVGSAASAFVSVAGDALALSGDALKAAFGSVNSTAKAALDKIEFASGSIGDQVMSFIDNGFSTDNRFKFQNLTFDSGSAVIKAESEVEVLNLASILKAYPGVNIIIEGYTDNTGDAAANNQLSLMRAQSVKNRLVTEGIADARIKTEGYGSTNPISSNESEEGRSQNRRIEVRIIQ